MIVAELPFSAKILVFYWHQVAFPTVFRATHVQFFRPPSLLVAPLSVFGAEFRPQTYCEEKMDTIWTINFKIIPRTEV